jgi:hypothetical protein
MTNARGDQAQLVMRTQAVFGTPEASGDGTFYAMPFYSLNLDPSEELNEDEALYGDAFPGETDGGLIALSGSIEVPLGLSSIGLYLQTLLGAPVTTDIGGGKFQHVFEAQATPPIGLLTTGVAFNDVDEHLKHDSLVISSFEHTAKKDGNRARASLNLSGRDEQDAASAVDATPVLFAIDPTPVGFTGAVELDGGEIAGATELSFNLQSGLEMDQETMNGAATASALLSGRWGLSGSLGARFRDKTLYDIAKDGTNVDLKVSYVADADHSIEFLMRKQRLQRSGIPISGREVIAQSFNFQASRPDVGDSPFTVTLINQIPAYANPV